MDRGKQSSKRGFWCAERIQLKFLWLDSSGGLVILSQLLDDPSFSAGNGNSNCSSLLVLALRLTAVSGTSLDQRSHAAHTATPAVQPRLSFHALLLAGIVRFGALSNIAGRALSFDTLVSPHTISMEVASFSFCPWAWPVLTSGDPPLLMRSSVRLE